jgi:hypothetical protein
MARKKVREYDAKRMLKASLARLTGLELPLKAVQVRSDGRANGHRREGARARLAATVRANGAPLLAALTRCHRPPPPRRRRAE